MPSKHAYHVHIYLMIYLDIEILIFGKCLYLPCSFSLSLERWNCRLYRRIDWHEEAILRHSLLFYRPFAFVWMAKNHLCSRKTKKSKDAFQGHFHVMSQNINIVLEIQINYKGHSWINCRIQEIFLTYDRNL